MIDLFNIFPEIFLINAAIFILIFGVSVSQEKNRLSSITTLSLCSLLLTGLLLANQVIYSSNFFWNSFIIDNFTFFFKVLLVSSAFIVIAMSQKFMLKTRVYAFENFILILISVSTMMMLVSCYDLLPLYLTIELQSLCFYVLAASKRYSEFSTEAGLKYFLLGAFSSGILLFGFSFIYGLTGMTNFEDIAKLSYTQIFATQSYIPFSITIGILFIAVGFLFKITAVPFHMWGPDVYEGSPTYITAFFSIVPKIAVIGVFIRLFQFAFQGFLQEYEIVFILSSIASLILGSIAAIAQQQFKRLLAYSSIGHVGFMLIAFSSATIEGIQALLIYIIVYIIMSCGLFSIALALNTLYTKKTNHILQSDHLFIHSLSQFHSLGKINPVLASTFTIILFSMAGIPPLAGFCSKFYLFFAALSSSLFLLAFIGVITSVISCFYYIRFIKIMYFQTNTNIDYTSFSSISYENAFILACVGFFLIFFFIYPSPLFLWTHKAAIALCF